jgi:hypothetical protein
MKSDHGKDLIPTVSKNYWQKKRVMLFHEKHTEKVYDYNTFSLTNGLPKYKLKGE